MSTETWSRQQLTEFVREQFEDDASRVMAQVDRWLRRGDGAAVYRNFDLGHPEVGAPQIVSYGSRMAQLETNTVHVDNSSADGKAVEQAQAAMRRWHKRGWKVASVPADGREHPLGVTCPACSGPPERLPDIGSRINWRYQLVAVHREDPGPPDGNNDKTDRAWSE